MCGKQESKRYFFGFIIYEQATHNRQKLRVNGMQFALE